MTTDETETGDKYTTNVAIHYIILYYQLSIKQYADTISRAE